MFLMQKIGRNTIIHFLSKIISLFLNVFVFALIARYLGVNGFGEFTIVIAYLQGFAIFADLGLYMTFIQMLSLPNADEEKIASNFFTIRLVSSIFLLSLAPLICLLIPQYSHIVKLGIAITAISFLFGSLTQLLTGFFQKKMKMLKVAVAEIISKLVFVGLMCFVVYSDAGFLSILGVVVVGGFINFILLYLFSRKFVKISLRFDKIIWRNAIKKTWPIGLSIILTTIYFKGDTVILSLFKSSQEVGIYGAAYRILEALIMFPPIFMGLILPHLTLAWANKDIFTFKRIFQKSFDFFTIIAIPLIIGTLFLAKPLMVFVAGEEFSVSAEPLKILIFATALIFFGSLVSHTIIAMNKQRAMLWFYSLAAVVALIGYLIFIPRYSYYGAAYMTIVAELIITVSAFIIIQKNSRIFPSFKIFGPVILSSSVMGFVLSIFNQANLFLLIFLAILVYFSVLYLLRGINKKMIKDIIKTV